MFFCREIRIFTWIRFLSKAMKFVLADTLSEMNNIKTYFMGENGENTLNDI